MSVNSRLKATSQVKGKHFIGREFQKEIIDIDILLRSRNGDRKIMQSM